MHRPRRFSFGLLVFVGLFCLSFTADASSQHLAAFVNFVKTKNFTQANFYLRQGYLKQEDLDTSQIYFRIAVAHDESDVEVLPQVYQYLNALKTIDLNRQFLCKSSGRNEYEKPCYMVNLLARGQSVDKFQFYAERGLNLNAVFADAIPAPFLIINRLGTQYYSLANINQLTAMGMVFGDELYDPSLMQDPGLNRVVLPLDTGAVTSFHFMDMLTISLGNVDEHHQGVYNRFGMSELQLSRRDELVCSFISHSAQKFAPSFDYLRYLMDMRQSFRAENLRAQPDPHNRIYFRAFPNACVQLVSALARSHPHLETMVSEFAAKGDVETAQWLLTFQQQR
ncbi:hypothetical protein [uncultured Cohaesibacter sp.]|uniref:hypothetical protein n=1 Tax=uncultured Cohaesibacter sp. TaxID=1002546 RepID=UPI002AAA6CFC|nr:hypothetical protein [uncultured Cohaesibacter sp.]